MTALQFSLGCGIAPRLDCTDNGGNEGASTPSDMYKICSKYLVCICIYIYVYNIVPGQAGGGSFQS